MLHTMCTHRLRTAACCHMECVGRMHASMDMLCLLCFTQQHTVHDGRTSHLSGRLLLSPLHRLHRLHACRRSLAALSRQQDFGRALRHTHDGPMLPARACATLMASMLASPQLVWAVPGKD